MDLKQFKDSIDIIELIGTFLPLKKMGANYWSNCPFHSEKTPSFCIDSMKGFYKCFGCGEGGDAIKFVMKYKNLDFKESCILIANICNLNISFDNKRIDAQPLENAKRIYLNAFFNSPAYEYALKRGLNEQSIAKFELGYGVKIENNEAKYNFKSFENRLILPIYMPSGGRLAGFGARDLSLKSKIKYINSPQSELFNKSMLIYGLHYSKDYIVKKQRLFIVEGYFDCILAQQNGFLETVAPLGTSLSKENLNRLSKLTPNIILSFDNDTAGVNATLKAIDLCLQLELDSVKVLMLDTKHKDLADFFTKEENAKEKFENAKLISIFDYFILYAMKDFYNKNVFEKQKALNNVKFFLLKIKSNFLRISYENKIIERYKLDKNIFKDKKEKQTLKVSFTRVRNINEASIIKLALENERNFEYIKTYLNVNDFEDYKEDFEALINKKKLKNEVEISSVNADGFELRYAILEKINKRYNKELINLSKQEDIKKAFEDILKIKEELKDIKRLINEYEY